MTSTHHPQDRIGAIRPGDSTVPPPAATDGRGHEDPRSTGALLRDLRDQTTALLRQELALARTEMKEKVGLVGRNVAYMCIGGLIAALGIVFLLAAATALLAAGLVAAGVGEWTASWLSPLILGVVVGIVGYALIKKATTTLREARLYPDKTVKTMKENARWAGHKTTT